MNSFLCIIPEILHVSLYLQVCLCMYAHVPVDTCKSINGKLTVEGDRWPQRLGHSALERGGSDVSETKP